MLRRFFWQFLLFKSPISGLRDWRLTTTSHATSRAHCCVCSFTTRTFNLSRNRFSYCKMQQMKCFQGTTILWNLLLELEILFSFAWQVVKQCLPTQNATLMESFMQDCVFFFTTKPCFGFRFPLNFKLLFGSQKWTQKLFEFIPYSIGNENFTKCF